MAGVLIIVIVLVVVSAVEEAFGLLSAGDLHTVLVTLAAILLNT